MAWDISGAANRHKAEALEFLSKAYSKRLSEILSAKFEAKVGSANDAEIIHSIKADERYQQGQLKQIETKVLALIGSLNKAKYAEYKSIQKDSVKDIRELEVRMLAIMDVEVVQTLGKESDEWLLVNAYIGLSLYPCFSPKIDFENAERDNGTVGPTYVVETCLKIAEFNKLNGDTAALAVANECIDKTIDRNRQARRAKAANANEEAQKIAVTPKTTDENPTSGPKSVDLRGNSSHRRLDTFESLLAEVKAIGEERKLLHARQLEKRRKKSGASNPHERW